MKVLKGPWAGWERPAAPTSVTIGVLDGVHRGHRALIDRLEPSMLRTVLTFDPHPVEVLRPGTAPRLITTIEERISLLEATGVEWAGVLDLAEIREQAPEEFVEDVLSGKLGVAHLVVGIDFRFGRDRSGDVPLLQRLAPGLGFVVETIDLVSEDGTPVSSSRIRGLVEEGRVVDAASLLGRWYAMTNTVVDGDKRGGQIGYPTANIRPPGRKVVPRAGVYATFVALGDGTRLDAAVNVGVRPTFGGGELLVEAHILDFSDDIYGREMTVEFVEYLRPELEFAGVEELVDQMGDDVAQTREILDRARTRI
ncbi:MAG TPA: bifunctional riboflavin kinase/FAD synthetase [Acidimicrobiia bacterium]|nr:bifunctional riboflavin kinase/FAD synthetase [Acidimicrobiia bacterium]